MIGTVLRIDAKVCHVQIGSDTHVLPLRGRLFEERGSQTRPVAVGDSVEVTLDAAGGAIDAVLPRRTQLVRRRAGATEHDHVVAANISLVLAVAAVREPAFQTDLVDRILAGAEREGIAAVIVLTKLDRDRKNEAPSIAAIYRNTGYPIFETSLIDPSHSTSLDQLTAILHQNMTVLTGASGVGKSSLLNHLVPGLDLRVGSLGHIRQGRHTTTHTQLIPLPGGGHVLDTPGIRSFGMHGMDILDLSFCMPEFRQPMQQCSYRNCTHTVEPDCGVLAALADGAIAPSRYQSYVTMLRDLE